MKGRSQSKAGHSRCGVSPASTAARRRYLWAGKRINFLRELVEATRGRSGRITQGDVRFGDLANVPRTR